MSLAAWILAAMRFLAPLRPVSALQPQADALESVIRDEGPIFAGQDGDLRTAATMVAIGYRESTFTLSARGDLDGVSVCTYQIMGGSKSLLADAAACTRAAYALLRASVRACPGKPVSAYAAGRCGTAQGDRISDDRMRLANILMAKVAQ